MGAERNARRTRARARFATQARGRAQRARAQQWRPVEYPGADRLVAPRREPPARERPPSAAEPFLVPAFVARHQDNVVRALVGYVERLYHRRRALRVPLLNHFGQLLIPEFPELLQRPQKRAAEGEPRPDRGPDFGGRRSDHMQAVVRVLLVLAACCDWATMEILDPRGGFLSVARLAELAELPLRADKPAEAGERGRLRVWRTENALRTLREASIVCFTKQHRETLEDGSHTSTAPALRKLAVGFFRKFGGELLRVFDKRRKKLKERRQNEAPSTGDMRVAAVIRETRRALDGVAFNAPTPAIVPGFKGATPQSLIDQIHEENPSWSFGEIIAEAHRRLALGP